MVAAMPLLISSLGAARAEAQYASTSGAPPVPVVFPPSEVATEMRSPAMVGIGSTLLVAGAGAGLGLAIASSQVSTSGAFGGLGRLPYVLGSFFSFEAGLGAGLPLVIVGARQVPANLDEPAQRIGLAPSRVQIGLGTASAAWEF